ncbi:MAG: allantoinase AllB [Terriglobales bacterium]
MPGQAFLSRRIVTTETIRSGAVLVREGKISGLISAEEVPAKQIPPNFEVLDFGNSAILPGLVDSHVHINEPGRTEWEGFKTATEAAAAGGYTTLVDMPLNCLPPTATVAALTAKRQAAQGKCRVDWLPWGGVVSDNQADIEPLAAAGVPGFKCFLIHPGIDGFTMVTEQQLRAALPHVARTGLPLLVHAELPGPIDEATRHLQTERADWRSYSTYLQSRPEAAELSAIRLLLSLCREYKFRLHIVHLSASQALPELCAAKAAGLPVTVETCPHYLHFCAEEIPDRATLCKCAPPIRSRENRETLWQGLQDGVIDLVATDHSPCPPAMKRSDEDEGSFKTAWGGIASLSLALPIMWSEASRRKFTLVDLARWMASAPAQLAGCAAHKGRIAEGCDADFVIFDDEAEFVVTEDRLYYRHLISPYLGKKLQGVVKATYLRGQLVFSEGAFHGEPKGREIGR